MKNRLTKIVCVSLVVLALVLFCPLPTPVRMSVAGQRFSDGAEQEAVEMHLRGWKLNYLCKTDAFRGEFSLSPYTFDDSGVLNVKISAPLLLSDDETTLSFSRYDAETNQMVIAELSYTNDEMVYHDQLHEESVFQGKISE